ncbi:MAG TPA: methyltransferase domain-containing protein [Candidatus Korarchaeota archaeon]|nr:methyltransferase domain-containing protein [Candidatus Korarchaeota archaeon]
MAVRPRDKRELEIILQRLRGLESPKPHLEQHSTPPNLASALIHWVWLMGDLEDLRVADLGCGNGILAIGAVLYGAESAVGVDIDPEAVKVAQANAEALGVTNRVNFLVMDVEKFERTVDTVIQNPPFGVVRRHADLKFLDKALQISRVVYSIHMAGNSRFLAEFASKRGARLTHVEKWPFPLRRIFHYHRKRLVNIPVEILRFEVIA